MEYLLKTAMIFDDDMQCKCLQVLPNLYHCIAENATFIHLCETLWICRRISWSSYWRIG